MNPTQTIHVEYSPSLMGRYTAFRGDYEGPDSDGIGGSFVGYGDTEEEAIADLREREEEDADLPEVLFGQWRDSEPPVPRGRFAPGWWIVPAVIVGVALYGMLAAWFLQHWKFQ